MTTTLSLGSGWIVREDVPRVQQLEQGNSDDPTNRRFNFGSASTMETQSPPFRASPLQAKDWDSQRSCDLRPTRGATRPLERLAEAEVVPVGVVQVEVSLPPSCVARNRLWAVTSVQGDPVYLVHVLHMEDDPTPSRRR